MNIGSLRPRLREKAAPDTRREDDFVDPAEQVRSSIDKSIGIGSPLLYPF